METQTNGLQLSLGNFSGRNLLVITRSRASERLTLRDFSEAEAAKRLQSSLCVLVEHRTTFLFYQKQTFASCCPAEPPSASCTSSSIHRFV
jgi:hypothetical protein